MAFRLALGCKTIGYAQVPRHCCNFTATFAYNAANCTLEFRLTKSCEDINDDVTVTITGPSGPVEVIPQIDGRIYTWGFYRPAAGTWTVNASLDCGLGSTFEQEYSTTVTSEPCTAFCCARNRPLFATVAASGCCAWASGTYAFDSFSTSTCAWSKSISIPPPTIPAGQNCPSSSPCFSLNITHAGQAATVYFYPAASTVTVFLDASSPDVPLVLVTIVWRTYVSYNGGPCGNTNPGGGPNTLAGFVGWYYRMNCSSGSPGTILIDDGTGVANGTLSVVGPTGFAPCGRPSVYVEMET